MDLYFYISKIATPLIVPSNFFILLLIVFFYIGFIKNKIFFRKFFIVIFIIFSTISIFPIGHNLIFFFLEKNFYSSKIPSKINYIFVPSGSMNRIISAINLVKDPNLDDIKIIYSSGIAYLDKNKSTDTEANLVKTLIANSKIDIDNILFFCSGVSDSTVTSQKLFQREIDLLNSITKNFEYDKIIYFGSLPNLSNKIFLRYIPDLI